ncbi:sequence-specific DNA binding transcription factors, partial [Striga asiatica]
MAGSKSSRKRTIDSGVDGEISTNSSSRSNIAFINDKFRATSAQNLAKLVAAENLPLDFGDRSTFEDFCGSLNPAAKRVPAALLDNFYQEYKSKYSENFTEPQETGEIGDRGRGPFGRLSLCERFKKEIVERRRKERK